MNKKCLTSLLKASLKHYRVAHKKDHEKIECNLTKYQPIEINFYINLFRNEPVTLSQSSTKITLFVSLNSKCHAALRIKLMHCNALKLLTAMCIKAFNALTQRKRSFLTTHIRQIFSMPSWFISELNCEKIIKIGSELEKLFRICSCSFFMAHCVYQHVK